MSSGEDGVGVVRARGGVGTHWQPSNSLQIPSKCKPGVGSGEVGVGRVWARIGSLFILSILEMRARCG